MRRKTTRLATRLGRGALFLSALSALLAPSAHASGYRLDALDPVLPGRSSYGMVISASGLVLGETYVQQGCPLSRWVNCLLDGLQVQQLRSVWWQQPTSGTSSTRAMQAAPLACLDQSTADTVNGDKPCEALAVNAQGRAVGRSYVPKGRTGVEAHPVVWPQVGGPPMDLSPFLQSLPAHGTGSAVGINDQGWILGRADQGNGTEFAFLLRDGLVTTLPAMGASSVKAKVISATMAAGDGLFDKGSPTAALIWTLGGPTTVLRTVDGSDNDIHAEAVSSAGHVAGFYWAPASRQGNRAFVWFQGRAQGLPTDPGFSSLAHGVNAAGQVVGSHCRTDQDIHGCRAVVWTNGVRLDLNAMAQAPAGFQLVQARAINDQGQITGWMVNGAHAYKGFVLTPRP
jgi:hypothetical protein